MKAPRVLLVIVMAVGLQAPCAWAHKPTVTTFTYHADIRPIFEAKCGGCHRSGGVAPMSLLTYEEAYPWAVSIKNEVLNLTMPPWFADERSGQFKRDTALTAKELDTIVDWCLGGSPEGDASGAAVGTTSVAWALGPPDVALTLDAFELDADTAEAVDVRTLPTALDGERFLRAIDFRPGSASVVRSAIVTVRGDPQPLATWIPGQYPEVMPEGGGRRLPAGAELVLRIHYKKTWLDDGTAVTDRSTLGLYFHDRTPSEIVETVAVDAGSSLNVTTDAELVALFPRVEEGVESLTAELVLPDGSREPLIRVIRPDPEWPRKYWLQAPRVLPSGSRVEVTAGAPVPSSTTILLDLISMRR